MSTSDGVLNFLPASASKVWSAGITEWAFMPGTDCILDLEKVTICNIHVL